MYMYLLQSTSIMLQKQVYRYATKTFLNAWNKRITTCACRLSSSSKDKPENFYDVLGIPMFASEKEVKDAHLKLRKKFHPDSDINDKTLLDKFVKVNEAYDVLGNATQKELYDEGLKAGFSERSEQEPKKHSYDSKSKKKTESKKDGETLFYDHPSYYKDPQMKKKAEEFWKSMGHGQASQTRGTGTKTGADIRRDERQGAIRVCIYTTLCALVLYLLFSKLLKYQFPETADSGQLRHPRHGRNKRDMEVDMEEPVSSTEEKDPYTPR